VLALAARARAAAQAAAAPVMITNGVVTVALGAGGMMSLKEDSAPAAGAKPLALTLANDDWSAVVHEGNATSAAEPWINRPYAVTTKQGAGEVTLNTTTCSPADAPGPALSGHHHGTCATCAATLSWTCTSGYNVDVVYTLEPLPGASFVTKTLRISVGTSGPKEFVVVSVAPWTGLSVLAAGATQPADWAPFKNGFSSGLEVAGFARWSELRRGLFITVQNPFSTFKNGDTPDALPSKCPAAGMGHNHVGDDLPQSGPAGKKGLTLAECQTQCEGITDCAGYVYLTATCNPDGDKTSQCYFKKHANPTSVYPCACMVARPKVCSTCAPKPFPPLPKPSPPPGPAPAPYKGGVVLKASYMAGVAHSCTADPNSHFYMSDGATLGLTALSKYDFQTTGLNTGEYTAFTQCVEAFLLDGESRANKTVKVNVAWVSLLIPNKLILPSNNKNILQDN
jgi:hypothetical protein